MENKVLEDAKELVSSHIDETLSEDINLSPVDLAENLKTIKIHDEEEYVGFLKRLNSKALADVAMEIPEHMLEDIINNLSTSKIAEAISELESDDKTFLIKSISQIDENKAKELFLMLSQKEQEDILKLSHYDEDVAGAYMQTELFSGHIKETLRSAVERLRILKNSDKVSDIFQLFVVDDNKKLMFSISIADLIMYDFDLTLEEIIASKGEEFFKSQFAYDTDKIEDVVIKFEEFDLSVIPVVDMRGVLIGRITTDDIHDVIQESATEQLYNLAGVNDEAEEKDTVFAAGRARAVWLFVNLGTALLSATIIRLFDKTIESIVALAVLMPIVSAMGGNAGTQALTVTVRRLALGEIEFKDAWYVLKKEIGISIINGFIFAMLLGLVTFAWFKIPLLGLVIAASMVINMFFAGFFGAIIPMCLKKFGIDPAVGSSVLLTAITDIVGFFSFLGLATWILL